MEKVEWKVEGMDCTNCALTINKYLNKEGMKEVKVNFIGGDVSFEMNNDVEKETIAKGIEGLGYKVVNDDNGGYPFTIHHSPFTFSPIISSVFSSAFRSLLF